MAAKKRTYEDDDGRTIADMNVEGMPWYDRDRNRGREQSAGSARPPMDPTQRRATILAVVTAALLIAAVFGVGYFIVIFLMDKLLR